MLDIQNLKKSYIVGGVPLMVLKGIDLHIKKGDFIAIMGPSGSGKSTLMNMIGMLDTPTTGKYLFNNVNVANFDADTQANFRRDKIGFIFQMYNLLPRIEAWKQVVLPLFYKGESYEERYEKAIKVLTKLGLKKRVDHTPDMLSGGEQQRVSIGRALINKPDLLLCDEPTGALDSKTGKELMQLLCKLNKQGITIVMVTHEKEVASYAKKTIHIKDGLIHKTTKK